VVSNNNRCNNDDWPADSDVFVLPTQSPLCCEFRWWKNKAKTAGATDLQQPGVDVDRRRLMELCIKKVEATA